MTTTSTSRPGIDERLELHRAFWNRTLRRPIAAFRIAPDYFFSRDYRAAHSLLIPGKKITADMLHVDDFLPDYERLFQLTESIGQDAFYTAEPYASIPWMEAMLGCEVTAGDVSFVSEPWVGSPDQLDGITLEPGNPWLQKYLEFTEKLVELSHGRFPVGMPVMRGPADVAGALLGQVEMVIAMCDEPKVMQRLFLRLADIYSMAIKMQKERTPLFHGGQAYGFYHVYCPGKCTWYQEDLSAIISPGMYGEFLREPERMICDGYDYTCIHLHPASFFILNQLLENPWLRAIEVNKDVGGPSVEEMLPHLQKIAERKNLVLWGDFTLDEFAILKKGLPDVGFFMFITTLTPEAAERLLDATRNW